MKKLPLLIRNLFQLILFLKLFSNVLTISKSQKIQPPKKFILWILFEIISDALIHKIQHIQVDFNIPVSIGVECTY